MRIEKGSAPVKDDAASRKRRLHADLTREILTLARPPGSPLDEAALSAASGLSRTPLREVLRELAGEGLAVLHPNRGAWVSDMSHATLHHFFLAAPMLYEAVLRLAARFRGALASGGAEARTLANNRFHAVTGEMAANPYLAPSFNRLLVDHARIGMTFYRARDAAADATLARAADQHDAIIAAIAAGDEAAAARLAGEHWDLSRHEIGRYVMPAPLQADLGPPPEGPSS
jgi:DNA-binding GntR family transcriptional regulator